MSLALLGPLVLLLAIARIRFLTDDFSRIGHLVRTPDLYVKSGLLGWRPRYFGVLLAPPGSVANACLLHYWRRYIIIVSHPMIVAVLRPLAKFKRLQFTLGSGEDVSLGGSTTHVDPDRYGLLVHTQYNAKYPGQPLLNLSPSDFEEGWRRLKELGVPRDAWFVCLHVREAGYLPHLSYHSYRNSDVHDFLPAVLAQGFPMVDHLSR